MEKISDFLESRRRVTIALRINLTDLHFIDLLFFFFQMIRVKQESDVLNNMVGCQQK